MGISFFGLFEVRSKEPGWTQCPVWEASLPGDPREALSQAGEEVWESFRQDATSLLNSPPRPLPGFFERVPGFHMRLGSSSFLMKGQAGGVFVAGTAGRGGGPNGETPMEEGSQTAVCQGTETRLSYFMRKKTNKQTKRSKERGRKVSTETILRSPRRPMPPAGSGTLRFVLVEDPRLTWTRKKQNHQLNNQMALDWL